MIVTATDFKLNLGKYLELVVEEDIAITKNGRNVGVLVAPGVNTIRTMKGILQLPGELHGMDHKQIKEMRIREKYESID